MGDNLIIDIVKLKSGIVESIEINEKINLDLDNTEILELKNSYVKGYITKDSFGYYIDCNITGIMVLPCSITLKPVDYPFDIKVSGNIEEMLNETEKSKKIENTIDILPIIWENILMEIPIKVVSNDLSDVKLEGNGWKVIDEEEPQINPELQKLKDLLK